MEPPDAAGPRPVSFEPRECALIILLARGHTDASAALELGLSPRSVSSTVRRLMNRFGVDNRFQLGLAIGAQHPVPPGGPVTDHGEWKPPPVA